MASKPRRPEATISTKSIFKSLLECIWLKPHKLGCFIAEILLIPVCKISLLVCKIYKGKTSYKNIKVPKVHISAKFQLLKAILSQDVAVFQFLGVDHFSGGNSAGIPKTPDL